MKTNRWLWLGVGVVGLTLISPAVQAAETVVTDRDARTHIGEHVAVKGVVAGVFTSTKGNTFLSFGRPYPNQVFTAVIFSSAAAEFPNPGQWEGKSVLVRGTVKLYKGKPEIVLDRREQLSLAK